MTSIQYNQIFSRFYSRVEAYNLMSLSEEELNDFLYEYLHSVSSKPYIRKNFSSLSLDDETQTLKYEMNISLDEESDNDFVIEILSLGIAIQSIEPQLNSMLNIQQVFGSKEEKFYSQANHIAEVKGILESLRRHQRNLIAERNILTNSYLQVSQ